MADPCRRYSPSADRASVPRPALPGYVTPEALTLTSQPPWSSHDPLINSSDSLQKDNLGTGVHPGSGNSGYTAGASVKGYPSNLGDPYVPSIPDRVNKRPDSLKTSNILFVDGLPSDCSRREVSHLFRPFFGFREIKLVHKEPKTREDKPIVLCFVEFSDAKCAVAALEALQGYKFDNKKPNSRALKIHFSHFPFQLPSRGDEQRLAVPK